MVDPTTVNRGLAVPTRGSDVGTWDVPLNGDMNIIDTMVGAIVSVAVTNTNVALNSTQLANGTVLVTGTLTGSVSIIFPAVQGWWSIINQTTNSGGASFALYAASVGGTNRIGCPPGEQTFFQVNSVAGVNYVNLDRVGTYLDMARSTIPLWISGSTIPPYLNCDGTTFSGTTYPALADVLGGTTLPDLRGRGRFYLNQGTGRITTAGSGIDGNTIYSAGGIENFAIAVGNIPQLSVTITDPGHAHDAPAGQNSGGGGGSPINSYNAPGFTPRTGTSTTGITAVANQGSPNTAIAKMPPAAIGGLCLIRAA